MVPSFGQNMTLIRDVVFEQHYAKKVAAMLQLAGRNGFDQGFGQCLAIIDHFNKMDMPITVKTVQLFIDSHRKATQEAPIQQEPSAEPAKNETESPKRPAFQIVK